MVSSVVSLVMSVSSHSESESTESSEGGSESSDPLSSSVHHLLSVGSEFGLPDSLNVILSLVVSLSSVDDSVSTVASDHETSVVSLPDSLDVVLLPVDSSDPSESVSSSQSSLESSESELPSSAVMSSSMTSSVSSASHVMSSLVSASASLGFVLRSLGFSWGVFFSWSSFLGCCWCFDLFNLFEGSGGGLFSTGQSCSDQGA